MENERTLLFVFAHPDDESFLVAGVAGKYHPRGVRLILVTATDGTAGKRGDPPICTQEELAAVRAEELRAAAAILGIHHAESLGYKDKELAAAPHQRIREQLVGVIRSFRPDIAISFDPNGTNLHNDHIAISRYASDALAAAADPRWFPAAGEPHQVRRLLWTPPLPVWEAARVSNLATEPGIDFAIDIRPWRQQKSTALRAHRSQHISIDRVFFSQPDVERLLSVETFRQAWGPPLARRPCPDLFEGME